MSQIPRGDSSDFIVLYEYKLSQRDTFQPYVDELQTFIAGKYTHRHMQGLFTDCVTVYNESNKTRLR